MSIFNMLFLLGVNYCQHCVKARVQVKVRDQEAKMLKHANTCCNSGLETTIQTKYGEL